MIEDPSRVFHTGETGINVDAIRSSLSTLVLQKLVRIFNEKESITVLCNYSAAGVVVPPIIMFPYKRTPKELALSVPLVIRRSESGRTRFPIIMFMRSTMWGCTEKQIAI